MPYLLFIFGAAVGSFVNVVIYRLPLGRTFVKGRSECESCGKRIQWSDLIPIASFFILKFRCRYCKARISWAHPAVEICSGLIFSLSFAVLGAAGTATWIFSVILLELFLSLAVIDARHLILPDSLILFMAGTALLYGGWQSFFSKEISSSPILSLNHLEAALFAFLFFWAIWFFSNGKAMGLGDAKLAGMMGLLLGLYGSFLTLYLAIILGALWGIVILIARRGSLKTKLPLGSFISISASIFILFGPVIIDKANHVFRFVKPLLN